MHLTKLCGHFYLQENDQMLDGGALGDERKLYYRELIARFSHHVSHLVRVTENLLLSLDILLTIICLASLFLDFQVGP